MTNNEYGRLVEFIGRKFDDVDAEFGRVRSDVREQQAETRRHFDVVAEGLRGQMQLLAEGHQALVEGQGRILERVNQVERELGAMIRLSYAELEGRLRRCEQGLAAVQERVTRLEAGQ